MLSDELKHPSIEPHSRGVERDAESVFTRAARLHWQRPTAHAEYTWKNLLELNRWAF